jgi:two-component system response regulator PilR (NtrC family)
VAAFPVARSTRPRPTTSGEHGASVPRGRPLDGTRALVVEDDPGVRAVTLRFLQQAGAEVVAAEDGVEGIDVLRRSVANIEPFQLIVSDLRLPQGSGAEVLRAARKAWPEAALVAMSGFLEDDAIARMAESQELVFLPKPFTAQQLVQAVEAARANLHRG